MLPMRRSPAQEYSYEQLWTLKDKGVINATHVHVEVILKILYSVKLLVKRENKIKTVHSWTQFTFHMPLSNN